MWYPHTLPFMRNKIPYFLLETPKTHVVQMVQLSKYPSLGKMRGKKPQLCPFTGNSTLFSLYRTHAFIFLIFFSRQGGRGRERWEAEYIFTWNFRLKFTFSDRIRYLVNLNVRIFTPSCSRCCRKDMVLRPAGTNIYESYLLGHYSAVECTLVLIGHLYITWSLSLKCYIASTNRSAFAQLQIGRAGSFPRLLVQF